MREELFYRAILQSALERVLHPIAAVLVATILFALSHIGAQPINLATMSSFVALGVVLGTVYQHTRNLWIVVALHGIADFLIWMPYISPIAPSIGFVWNLIAVMGAVTWWSLNRTKDQTGA
jgi:membrane protease YdiL (CAAX protease family)